MEIKETAIGKIAFYRHDTVAMPEAVILLIHGLGEHSGRYDEWAKRFTDSGVALMSFDLPGHGLSGGKRGTMPSFTDLYSYFDSILDELHNEFKGIPVILYGHSLGGGMVLHYLIKNAPDVKGAIVTSPWIRLTEEPPRFKVWLASVSKKLVPDMTQPSGLKTRYLSHDSQVVSAYESDPLVHGLISAGLFASMTSAGNDILQQASGIKTPLLLMHGRDDMITSPSGTIEVAGEAPSVTLKLWDGAYHEVHNESIKDEHFSFIREWIDTLL